MKLLGSTKSEITKNENGENVPNLQITKVVLVHCKIANNDYQQGSNFAPNKSFGQLVDISPKIFLFLKFFDLEFSCIEVWFTEQSSKNRNRR